MPANNGSRFVYFLVGLGIGAAITALFTPTSGDETREYLSQKTNILKDQAAAAVEHGKNVVAQKKEQLAGAIDAGLEAYKTKTAGAETDS